jgi:hypothetical protein
MLQVVDSIAGGRDENRQGDVEVSLCHTHGWTTSLENRRGAHAIVAGLAALFLAGRSPWTVPTASAQPSAAPAVKTTVVFVCEHGAARTVIAAAYFNQLADYRDARNRIVAYVTEVLDELEHHR